MPRVPELETAYFAALGLMENQSNLPLVGRLWQLTNTRYILGSKRWSTSSTAWWTPSRSASV